MYLPKLITFFLLIFLFFIGRVNIIVFTKSAACWAAPNNFELNREGRDWYLVILVNQGVVVKIDDIQLACKAWACACAHLRMTTHLSAMDSGLWSCLFSLFAALFDCCKSGGGKEKKNKSAHLKHAQTHSFALHVVAYCTGSWNGFQ